MRALDSSEAGLASPANAIDPPAAKLGGRLEHS
jgi:hypothetical protein